MTKKTKVWTAWALFVAVFGGLLLTATFTDLQVSHMLTAKALPAGAYYTNDFFGAVFECIGSAPVYLMLAFSIQILFWYVLRFWQNKPLKTVVCLVGVVGSTAAYYVFLNETIGYFLEHLDAEAFESAGFLKGTALFLAGLFTFFATLAVRNFSDASIKKLASFAFAIIATVILANAVVAIVKIPVGRLRYRAMNSEGGQSIGGFANFTRWYVANGQMEKTRMLELFGTTDACKSFPSGHTCAAGTSYGLIMLIDVLHIQDKKKKLALWLLPIVFTGTVAISRIVVGAHFFSDVLMGGTISFVSMMLLREILVCKGAHIKAAFGK